MSVPASSSRPSSFVTSSPLSAAAPAPAAVTPVAVDAHSLASLTDAFFRLQSQFVDLSSTLSTLCSALTHLRPSPVASVQPSQSQSQSPQFSSLTVPSSMPLTIGSGAPAPLHNSQSAPISSAPSGIPSSSQSPLTSHSPSPRSPSSPVFPPADPSAFLPSGPVHHPSKSLPASAASVLVSNPPLHSSASGASPSNSSNSASASSSGAGRRVRELSAIRFKDLTPAQKRAIAPFSFADHLSPEPPTENSQSGKIPISRYEEEEEEEAAALAADAPEAESGNTSKNVNPMSELSLDASADDYLASAESMARKSKRAARHAPADFTGLRVSTGDSSSSNAAQSRLTATDLLKLSSAARAPRAESTDSTTPATSGTSSAAPEAESKPVISPRPRYRRFSTSALDSDLKAAAAAAMSAPIGASFTREPPAGSKRSSAPLPGSSIPGLDDQKEIRPLDDDDELDHESEMKSFRGSEFPPGVLASRPRRHSSASIDDLKEFHTSQMHFGTDNRVKLNVGGQIFTTTISTLTREKLHPNMFTAMFSGNFELEKDERGAIFIDRDPTFFRHILNYLRDGSIHIQGMSTLQKQALLRESRYFGVTPLVTLLTADARQMKNNARRELSSEKEYKLIFISGEKFDKELPVQFNKMTIHEGYDFESWLSGGKTKGVFMLFSKKLSRGELMLLDRLQTGM